MTRRRLRITRRVLLIAAVFIWLGAATWPGVIKQQLSSEYGGYPMRAGGQEVVYVISWRQGGSMSHPAWSELTFELTPDYKNLPANVPGNDVAIERTDVLTYIFRRPDGTTYGPVALEFSAGNDRAIESYRSQGIAIDVRRPGLEVSWLGVLVSLWEGVVQYWIVGVVAVALIMVSTLQRVWFRKRANECPQCGYDLRDNVPAGCPECGWGRVENPAS